MVKAISRDHVRFNIQLASNHTMKDFFLHYVTYIQFSSNVYRKLLIDGWESLCGYLNGDKGNLVISRTFPNFANYTNLNQKCPYAAGNYFINISDLYVNKISPITLIPSGRYRLEISAHEIFNGPMLGKLHLHLSVSDHRIEKV